MSEAVDFILHCVGLGLFVAILMIGMGIMLKISDPDYKLKKRKIKQAPNQKTVHELVLEYQNLICENEFMTEAHAIFHYMKQKNMTRGLGFEFISEISKLKEKFVEDEISGYWRKYKLGE